MQDHDLDKMFKDNIDAIEINVDSQEIWEKVKVDKKKRRRLFFWWMSSFMTLALLGFIFWPSNGDDLSGLEDITQQISIDSKTEKNQEASSSESLTKEIAVTKELQIENNAKPELKANEHSSVTVKQAVEIESIVSHENASSIESKDWKINSIPAVFQSQNPKAQPLVTASLIKKAISVQKEDTRNLEKTFSLLPYPNIKTLSITRDELLMFLFLPMTQNKKNSKLNEIYLYTGLGTFNKSVKSLSTNGGEILSARQRSEEDRFSVYHGLSYSREIRGPWSWTANVEHQRHYAYMQDSVSSLNFVQDGFETTFEENKRRVKSNIIINQLHLGLLANYRWTKNRYSLHFSTGVSYNVLSSANGKTWLAVDRIESLDQNDLLKSSALGIIAKARIQYDLRENLKLNIGLNAQKQLGAILKSEDFEQRHFPIFLSAGLSRTFGK